MATSQDGERSDPFDQPSDIAIDAVREFTDAWITGMQASVEAQLLRIREVVDKVHRSGAATGLSYAADYIQATIREVGIIGDALAILIIIRDQLRLTALNLTTDITEEAGDAESP